MYLYYTAGLVLHGVNKNNDFPKAENICYGFFFCTFVF